MDLEGKRWCYWLDETKPGKTPATFRVSVVIDGESGHYPTGTDDKAPWYWPKATCVQRNLDRGISEQDAMLIVLHSMGNQNLRRRAQGVA